HPVGVGHVAVGGPDGDGQGGVAGVVDGHGQPHVGLAGQGGEAAVAGVAGGHDHHHPRADQAGDLGADGALAAGEPLGGEVVYGAEVDPVDPQQLAVAVDVLADVLERPEHVHGLAVAAV